MKRIVILFGAAAIAAAPAVTLAAPTAPPTVPAPLSISPPVTTGQPGASCEDLGNQPGQAINNTGSAFAPDSTSGALYAGNHDTINNKNTVSVSQYDVACLHNQSPF